MDKRSADDIRVKRSLSSKASRDHITHRRSSSWEAFSHGKEKELAKDQFTERVDKTQRFPGNRSDRFMLATDEIDRDRLLSAMKGNEVHWDSFVDHWKGVFEASNDTRSASELEKAKLALADAQAGWRNACQKECREHRVFLELKYREIVYDIALDEYDETEQEHTLQELEKAEKNWRDTYESEHPNHPSLLELKSREGIYNQALQKEKNTWDVSENARGKWEEAISNYGHESQEAKDAEANSHEALVQWRAVGEVKKNVHYQTLEDKKRIARNELEHAGLILGRALRIGKKGEYNLQRDLLQPMGQFLRCCSAYKELLKASYDLEVNPQELTHKTWLRIGMEGASSDRDVQNVFWHDVRQAINENKEIPKLKSIYDDSKRDELLIHEQDK